MSEYVWPLISTVYPILRIIDVAGGYLLTDAQTGEELVILNRTVL